VPGALDAQDPELAEVPALAGLLAPDETQLLYSMVLHGREELSLMSDEYGALTMVLLRFLAFPSAGDPQGPRARPTSSTEPARDAAPARGVPLRAAAPPALTLPAAPAVAGPSMERDTSAAPASSRPAAPAARAVAEVQTALGDRWADLVPRLCERGAAALVRELAMQAGLRFVDEGAAPPRWHLLVERETLRTPALRDKLAAVLAAELGQPIVLELESGVPEDTPARREAAERQRRQAVAEETIREDPVVRELMTQFKSARIVPGSIKPV
jgi:DNA polymerase-3 subunit gamma/tau